MEIPSIDKRRHFLKAITWRIIASFITFMIGWKVTGDINVGIQFGIIDVVLKLVVYYIHERVWYRIGFGINKKKV